MTTTTNTDLLQYHQKLVQELEMQEVSILIQLVLAGEDITELV